MVTGTDSSKSHLQDKGCPGSSWVGGASEWKTMPILPSPSASPRTTPSFDIVERWVQLQEEMNHLNHTPSSSGSPPLTRQTVNKHSRRTKSATSPYRQKPVESLTVSFAKLLVNQINGASPSSTPTTPKRGKKSKSKKKQPRFNNPPVKITIRNNKPVTEVKSNLFFLLLFSTIPFWWITDWSCRRMASTPQCSLRLVAQIGSVFYIVQCQ